jgi:hypothetical protein
VAARRMFEDLSRYDAVDRATLAQGFAQMTMSSNPQAHAAGRAAIADVQQRRQAMAQAAINGQISDVQLQKQGLFPVQSPIPGITEPDSFIPITAFLREEGRLLVAASYIPHLPRSAATAPFHRRNSRAAEESRRSSPSLRNRKPRHQRQYRPGQNRRRKARNRQGRSRRARTAPALTAGEQQSMAAASVMR